jgi:Flp pilus assembly protein TadG
LRELRLDDRGAAVVESSLVLVLLIFLLLAILQLGFALHVRNTLVASAAEGARYAANADRSPEEGAARTRDLIRGALGDEYATNVAAGTEVVGGVTTVVVVVQAPLPVLGPLGITRGLVVRGHAFEESE